MSNLESSNKLLLSTVNDWTNKNFKWMNKPKKYSDKDKLCIEPDEKLDFWQKTFYKLQGSPNSLLIKDDGHFFYTVMSKDMIIVETEFSIDAKNQFDQAGIMIRFNKDNWLKTGLEYVDNAFKLSCVVTTNGFSDWSTQSFADNRLKLRVYRQGKSYVAENFNEAKLSWEFFRIAQINYPTPEAKLGVYTCSPGDAGCKVNFDYLNIYQHSGHAHSII